MTATDYDRRAVDGGAVWRALYELRAEVAELRARLDAMGEEVVTGRLTVSAGPGGAGVHILANEHIARVELVEPDGGVRALLDGGGLYGCLSLFSGSQDESTCEYPVDSPGAHLCLIATDEMGDHPICDISGYLDGKPAPWTTTPKEVAS